VKLNRFGKCVGTPVGVALSVTALLTLTACGSDNNSGSSSSSAAGSSSSASADCGGKNNLTAEGSTAQQNAIAEFNKVWGQTCSGKTLSYNPTGSGAGVTQFIAKQVDFAGSDSALTDAQVAPAAARCGGNPAWNLPLVFGPVALVYNLQGVDKLTLNAEVIAKIFTGAITTWNDPAIAALNSGATLPSTKITPIFRSDESGTTDNFQKYLTAAAPQAWTKGAGKAFQGGAGEGAAKTAGVVQAVQSTDGAIGYAEQSPAKAANLPFAAIDNGGGAVALTDETTGKAVADAKFKADGMDLALDLNALYATKEAGAYPLMLATYEIVCSKGYDADTAAAVKSFLTVSANQGQANLSAAGFVPLPDSFKQRLLKSVAAIS
jgi:phosphate transport system substrate-binding protein